jgi:hypothetical protein
MRKKLPIGIQTFREIREEDHYYVDKTGFALRLITEGKSYFLSRPRRFGKSLLLDTLAELFEGNEPLFRGLYCHSRWDWSVKYPVIRLNLGQGLVQSVTELQQLLGEQIRQHQICFGVTSDTERLSGQLQQLIERSHARYGQRVVVLVDEYDKPILDHLAEPELARAMRDQLRDIYSVLKGSDAHLKFVFLTGVSKFSKVSLFSGLNNLEDITVNRDFSALCGYTGHDVESVFGPELEGLDRETIRRWYNGYNWTGEAVYNPFDLLLLFRNREFRPYWFETGTPTFLIEFLTRRRFFVPQLSQTFASESLLSAFDVDKILPEALLWQTGYLTFSGTNRQAGGRLHYGLTYPNLEVQAALNDHLFKAFVQDEREAENAESRLWQLLKTSDLSGLKQHLSALFASIPYNWHVQNDMARFEGYYASVFYSHLAALGLDLQPEDVTHQGRIDLSLRCEDQIYLFEFKLAERFPGVSPLQQIRDRGYADKFAAEGLPIHCIGIVFSEQARNVIEWEQVSIPPQSGVTPI